MSGAYLSTSAVGRTQRNLALGVLALSVLVFVAAAPFAKTLLPAVPAFLPIYQSALVINDLITAVLLFGQFGILRSRALLILASAYLFSAAMAVAHLLSFPGLFAPGGLFGAGPQTTAWLYFLWHGGFPLLVIAYALTKDEPAGSQAPGARRGPAAAILASVALVLATACGLMFLTTAMHNALPEIMRGDRDASTKVIVASVCWALSLAALPILWRLRSRSLVDLWLLVTICVWIFDIALSSVLNGGRYDLGWYGGRVYGLLAASFVMMALLLENSVLHARVATGRESERRQARAALARHEERLRIVHEIDRAIIAGAKPDTIAAGVLQPLRNLLSARRLNINMIDYAAGELEWLAAAGRRRTHVGSGVRFPMHMIGDLDALRRGETQTIDTARLPPSPQRDLLLASGVRHYMAVPMIAGGELIGALSFGGEDASFPQDQVTMVQEVATQLAVAIGQARLFEQSKRSAEALARQAERLRIVHEIDRAIIAEAKTEAIAEAVMQPLRELLGARRVSINMIDFGAGEPQWLAAGGPRRTRVGPGEGFPLHILGDVEALKRGEPQAMDTAKLPPSPARDALLASGVHHYVAVPMSAGGELIGTLGFGGEQPPDAERVTIAQEVATQLAVAINQARLFERVKHDAEVLARQAERLRIVHEIDRGLVGEVDLHALATTVLQPLRELLGVPRVVVNLFDLAAGEVEWLAAAGRRRTHVGPGVRYPLSYMGDLDALKRGETQIIDTQKLPPGAATDALLSSGVRVYMAVPMIAGGELIGALSFGGELPEFPAEQVTIAKEVATQLAIAITQARLFESVKRHGEELEKRVAERTAALQAANKELEAFSYSVSHDLRAPLRAVDGYALMLAEDYGARLDDEGRRLLGVVRASAEQMGRLIDDLLKFSQVGRRSLVRAPVDMRALAGEVVAELAPAYPKARVELGALPAAVGDRAMLRQVWTNLISNALKYSSQAAAPRVQISARTEGEQNTYSVGDNGAGFEMRYYEKLFNVFQRLHRQDEFEGTGVGLAIVQRVVVRHGGRVWAEGEVGKGATFRFELPAKAEQ